MDLTREQWHKEALYLESCARVVRRVGERLLMPSGGQALDESEELADELIGACRVLRDWVTKHHILSHADPSVRARFDDAIPLAEALIAVLRRDARAFLSDDEAPRRLAELTSCLADAAEHAQHRAALGPQPSTLDPTGLNPLA